MCISWTRKGLISLMHGVTMKTFSKGPVPSRSLCKTTKVTTGCHFIVDGLSQLKRDLTLVVQIFSYIPLFFFQIIFSPIPKYKLRHANRLINCLLINTGLQSYILPSSCINRRHYTSFVQASLLISHPLSFPCVLIRYSID